MKWLTIPVEVKGKYHQKINETLVVDDKWRLSHWSQLQQNYKTAAHFEEIAEWLKPLYLDNEHTFLSDWNLLFIKAICAYIGIETVIRDSREFELVDGKTERLAELCQELGGTKYISGPAARGYIEERTFSDKGIELSWIDYSGYSVYPQLYGEFEHSVTVLDLLFNLGGQSKQFMKHCK